MFSTAARAAPEWTIPGIPLCGERVTLITLPPPCGMNALVAAAWVISQVPWTLSSITVRKPFGGDRLGRAQELAAGVVDQQVEPAVPLDHAVEERVDGLVVADVEGLGLGRCRPRLDRRDRLLERLGAAPAADHRRAQPGELERGRPAEPRARAGDDADLPVEQPWGEDCASSCRRP